VNASVSANADSRYDAPVSEPRDRHDDPPAIAVAVIEDDRATREGMRLLLSATPGFRCVGAWGSVEESRAARPESEPQVLLLDVRLPGLSGPEALPQLRERWPGTMIVMLTSMEDEGTVVEALSNGAVGYVLKRTPPARILEAVQETVEGGSPMSPEIARRVVTLFGRRGAPRSATVAAPEARLSGQETRLLALLAEGHGYHSAAEALGISVNTVRKHIRNLYEKLEVHTRSEAVGKAMRGGLI
jgi:DNA-binding NarL/FixJ family response regulator